MKKCGTCFRYCENWRDAKAKGMKEIYYHGYGDYFKTPRIGIQPHGIAVHCPPDKDIHYKYPACKYHEYRWKYNLKIWWDHRLKQKLKDWYRINIKVPIGSRRKPVSIQWKDYFNGIADEIIQNGEPVCPKCNEMPYSYEQCVFCGQRFLTKVTIDKESDG